jgi:hypothetical protein
MPVISYERKSWSLDVRVEHSLGTSDHRVLTFGPKRGEVLEKFTHEGPEGSSIPSLTSALKGGGGPRNAPDALPPGMTR